MRFGGGIHNALAEYPAPSTGPLADAADTAATDRSPWTAGRRPPTRPLGGTRLVRSSARHRDARAGNAGCTLPRTLSRSTLLAGQGIKREALGVRDPDFPAGGLYCERTWTNHAAGRCLVSAPSGARLCNATPKRPPADNRIGSE